MAMNSKMLGTFVHWIKPHKKSICYKPQFIYCYVYELLNLKQNVRSIFKMCTQAPNSKQVKFMAKCLCTSFHWTGYFFRLFCMWMKKYIHSMEILFLGFKIITYTFHIPYETLPTDCCTHAELNLKYRVYLTWN